MPASCPPRALAPLALACGLAVLAGCGRRGHEAPTGGAVAPPAKARLKRNVELVAVKRQKLDSFVETVGYLDAEGQADISAGVSGLVEEVLFREGDWVIKDQTLLVRVEPRKYEALFAQAEANLKKAEANVKRVEAMNRRTVAGVVDAEQTLSLRKTVLGNMVRAGRAVKTEERQEAQSAVEVAAARLEVAKAEKEVGVADLEAASKEVEAARALFTLAQTNLDRSRVRAPYTGQINTRKVTRGTHVEDKTVIATMADLSRLRLVGYIPEKATPMVRQMLVRERSLQAGFLAGGVMTGAWGAVAAAAIDQAGETPAVFKIEFTLRPFPDEKFYGRLFYLSTVANPETHLFECKAEVPTRGVGEVLRPGFTAKIRCPLPGRSTSLVIPEEAVRASERGFVAFRPRAVTGKEGQVEYVAEAVPLELGQRGKGYVEVLGGLRDGDWVVSKGAEALENDTPLAVPPGQVKQMAGASGQ